MRREIVRVVTPGTLVEERLLERASNNYLAAFVMLHQCYALVYADLSTGEVNDHHCRRRARFIDDLLAEMHRIAPVEVVVELSAGDKQRLEPFIESLGARIASPEPVPMLEPEILDGYSREESAAMSRALDVLQAYTRRVGFASNQPLRALRCYRPRRVRCT